MTDQTPQENIEAETNLSSDLQRTRLGSVPGVGNMGVSTTGTAPLNPDAVRAALAWFAEAVNEVEVKRGTDGTRPGDYWNGYRAAKTEIADLLTEPKLIEKATKVALAAAQPVVNSVEELVTTRTGLALANAAFNEGLSAGIRACNDTEPGRPWNKPASPYSAPLLAMIKADRPEVKP